MSQIDGIFHFKFAVFNSGVSKNVFPVPLLFDEPVISSNWYIAVVFFSLSFTVDDHRSHTKVGLWIMFGMLVFLIIEKMFPDEEENSGVWK